MAETILNFAVLPALMSVAVYEAVNGNIAMTVFFCTLMLLYLPLWKLDLIEKRVQRICELLEGEEDDGED